MIKRWPPPGAATDGRTGDGAGQALCRAEERASLLARYWDDRVSEDLNLDIIGWWLDRSTDRPNDY